MARCSSCHCFSRNCPEGLPNHKDNTVGPNCTMNSMGRHYRDQGDTTVPVCDYVNCTFFTTDEFRTLDYPTDVTLGPVTAESQSAEISAIMDLLQQQKTANDERNLQMLDLQKQVTNLISNGLPAMSTPPTISLSQFSGFSMPTTSTQPPVFSQPTTLPSTVTSAAYNLSAALQSGLGQQNSGYGNFNPGSGHSSGLGHQQLSSMGLQPFDMANPLAGMGAALGTQGLGRTNSQVINSVDQLYAATTVNKQLRAHEFAASAQFPYKSQLNQSNCNAIAFAYGSFKHLEAIKSGLITNVSDTEFLARLRHLKNVFEVACLSSNLATFADPPWQVAREYDARVIADIESGVKTWGGLANGLETDAIYVAKEIVELKNKAKKPLKNDKGDNKLESKPKKDPKNNGCTTYNTHRASDGCFWEHQNKGETCVFDHFCSWCKVNRNTVEKHKIINCEHKTE